MSSLDNISSGLPGFNGSARRMSPSVMKTAPQERGVSIEKQGRLVSPLGATYAKTDFPPSVMKELKDATYVGCVPADVPEGKSLVAIMEVKTPVGSYTLESVYQAVKDSGNPLATQIGKRLQDVYSNNYVNNGAAPAQKNAADFRQEPAAAERKASSFDYENKGRRDYNGAKKFQSSVVGDKFFRQQNPDLQTSNEAQVDQAATKVAAQWAAPPKHHTGLSF